MSLPQKIVQRGFTLEVLSLYIPGVVQEDELEKIAGLQARVDPDIPLTILAFFRNIRYPAFGVQLLRKWLRRTAGLNPQG